MPDKPKTERHLLRSLSFPDLSVRVSWLTTESYKSRHTPPEYLKRFYTSFARKRSAGERPDAFLLTGAPVEHLDFPEISYWAEFREILDYLRREAVPSYFICWSATAALFHYYGIPSDQSPQKFTGLYRHRVLVPDHPLLSPEPDGSSVRGITRRLRPVHNIIAPHSHYKRIAPAGLAGKDSLVPLTAENEAGLYLITDRALRNVYITGHPEYEASTLKEEYVRDCRNREDEETRRFRPRRYFQTEDSLIPRGNTWISHRRRLYANWLRFYVRPRRKNRD